MPQFSVRSGSRSVFTAQKVYCKLAERLDEVGAQLADLAHVDRYSVADLGGISSQVGRSTRLHAQDPDVEAYLAIPEDAFDPHRPDLGAAHGVVHLYLSDIHPATQSDEYVGAMVRCGRTLFLRLTTSSTSRQVQRPDGPDENAYTILMVALLNHCAGTLKEIRWSDDTRRAGRATASWASITERAGQLGTKLTFGTTSYNPQKDTVILSVHGGMNQQDDVTRVMTLVGGRLEKLLQNTCPIGEGQLPHGVRHRRHPNGRVVIENKRKFAAADLKWHPVIVQALRMHAAGRSYIDIGLEVLAKNRLPRRGQSTAPGATYADLIEDRAVLSDSTKSFFVSRGRTGPGEEHLYLAKLALWETGSYPLRFNNNLKQRGMAVGGVVPTYASADDVTGYFDVVLKWNTPLVGFLDDAERSAVIAKCRARLLAERREPRQPQGREPRDKQVRALGGPFDRWAAEDERDERWPGEKTMYGVTTRTYNSGKNCFVLVHYPASTVDPNGHPMGLWRFTHKPAVHIAGTWAANAYCASVSVCIGRVVEDGLLDVGSVAPMTVMATPDTHKSTIERRRMLLESRRDQAKADADECEKNRAGLVLLAARQELAENSKEADEFLALAKAAGLKSETHARTAARLSDELNTLTDADPVEDERDANVTVLAYLQAGLMRASRENGRGGLLLQSAAATYLVQRRFIVRGDVVGWSCLLVVPLVEGGDVQIKLSGEIENVRERVGKGLVRADIIAQYVLRDARTLDDVANQVCVTRKTLLTQQVMPWLVTHGMTSRGGKNALVDHPIPLVKRMVYAHLSGKADPAVSRWGSVLTDHVVATYLDPDLDWGDAACPDETVWISRVLATVTQDAATRRNGVSVLDLALALGVSEDAVRQLVAPLRRGAGGFVRPLFLRYADGLKTRVRAIECPHSSCRGRRDANHVVLLPEVAASGFGVICSHCRRAPSTEAPWVALQFAHDYLKDWTNRGPGGSLRLEQQTLSTGPSGPLALGCLAGIDASDVNAP